MSQARMIEEAAEVYYTLYYRGSVDDRPEMAMSSGVSWDQLKWEIRYWRGQMPGCWLGVVASQRRKGEDMTALPSAGEWPCQGAPMLNPPPRLIAAMYRFMRDHMQPGDVEQVMLDVHDHDGPINFTNPHLEAYARSLCGYLLEGYPQHPFPYREGGAHILGPEVVASMDKKVISWQGRHYVLESE